MTPLDEYRDPRWYLLNWSEDDPKDTLSQFSDGDYDAVQALVECAISRICSVVGCKMEPTYARKRGTIQACLYCHNEGD